MPDSAATKLFERLAALPDPLALLQAIFANAPVGLQIYERSGRCLIVNAAHTRLFGGVPPPEYNIFEDNVLVEQGVANLVRRAFAGEQISIPAIWYDIRQLRNLPPEMDRSGGRRIAIAAEMVPLRASGTEVTHVLVVFNDVTETQEARERAEAAARAAEERARQAEFLADAGRVLASSLDLDVTLARVAKLATSSLCDMCVIDLVADDGGFRRVAAVHRDPALQPILDELRVLYPPVRGSAQPSVSAVATGKPDLNAVLDPALIAQRATSSSHADLLVRLGVCSQLTVPLLVGEQTLGAIVLTYTHSERRFSERDIPFVEALASHAAIAIENARLFHAAQLARTEAETANRAKDEFLAMLGHELRNPLAPIVTALEITRVRDGQSRERTIIERQVQHLRRLVDDLLDVARITRGSLELDRQPTDLAEAITEGIDLARPLLEQRHHTLELQVSPGLVVDGDRVRLAQVVANLMTNAARYTEPGGKITVTAVHGLDRSVTLSVRDTGVGMPPELVARVFETFARGSRPIDRAAGGLGLGLAIVKSLVTMHGGQVAARSAGPGHGSEFEVTLPAHDAATANANVNAAADNRPPARDLAAPGTVLVVDDNRDAAELLGEALTHRGFTVVVASDPYEAVSLAAEHRPRVALVDLGLPGMDGFELARRLRADPQHARLALVALTGFGQPSDRERTREAGFAEHLVKPVALDVVVPLVELLLAR